MSSHAHPEIARTPPPPERYLNIGMLLFLPETLLLECSLLVILAKASRHCADDADDVQNVISLNIYNLFLF
jgi:hypothetical protein